MTRFDRTGSKDRPGSGNKRSSLDTFHNTEFYQPSITDHSLLITSGASTNVALMKPKAWPKGIGNPETMHVSGGEATDWKHLTHDKGFNEQFLREADPYATAFKRAIESSPRHMKQPDAVKESK